MITLLLLLSRTDAATFNADLAAYLFGEEAVIRYYHSCIVTPYLPFIISFKEDLSFHSVRLRRCLLDSPSTAISRRRLQGRWLAFPVALQAKSFAFPAWPVRPYIFEATSDSFNNDYGIIPIKFLYRCSSFASILKASVYFPVEQDRLAFMKGPDTDHGLLSLYFVVFGNKAVGWRSCPGTVLGIITIYVRR